MKRILSLVIIIAILLAAFPAAALPLRADDDGACGDNAFYSVDGGVLTITGSGAMWDYSLSDGATPPWFDPASSITSIVIGEGITRVGAYAFYYCGARSVSLPSTLVSIGPRAFMHCGRLLEIELNSGLVSVGEKAFADCGSLTEAVIPASVSEIGASTFLDCVGLVSAEMAAGLPALADFMFRGCSGLVSVSLPEGVSVIPEGLFMGCSSLSSVSIPSSVALVSAYAFDGCSALSEVSFAGTRGEWEAVEVRELGNAPLLAASMSFAAPPSVTELTYSVTAVEGVTAEFRVEAEGASSYRWQYFSNKYDKWVNVSLSNTDYTGADADTMTVLATKARDGMVYRCVVKNAFGSAYTDGAVLTVVSVPRIALDPSSKVSAVGNTVSFGVKAEGRQLVYRWQYYSQKNEKWVNVSSANTDYSGVGTNRLTVFATAARDGMRYRCRVRNAAGTVYSLVAKLTVAVEPAITSNPASKTAKAGDTVSFGVKATGGALSYRWQYFSRKYSKWIDVSLTNSAYSGACTRKLTVMAAPLRDGMKYRCVVTNIAGTAYSLAAKLTVEQ